MRTATAAACSSSLSSVTEEFADSVPFNESTLIRAANTLKKEKEGAEGALQGKDYEHYDYSHRFWMIRKNFRIVIKKKIKEKKKKKMKRQAKCLMKYKASLM